jgi:hypothetical protein
MSRHRPRPIRCLWLALLLPVWAQGADLYHIHNLSERALVRTYEELLRDACRHADQFWQDSATNPQEGYWGSGRSDQMNEGIRAVSGMVLTCGALLKYSDALSPAEREKYLQRASHAIRYAVGSHRTGPHTCTDGKPWGGSWQSAMWTGTLSFGAWLMWDKLDPELRQGVERVLASEADRFLGGKPPTGRWSDTKAEENGWNMICLAMAANLCRTLPHAAAWREKAIEYMMNTLSVPQDATDSRVVGGKPVSAWFAGANLHPDFTLENHGFFHPAYVACSSYFLTQAAMYSTFALSPVPEAAGHHLMDTWKMLQAILLPGGESAFPQGMDWELHGLEFVNLYASLATWQQDALAARMENNCLQYMRAWQQMRNGDLAVPGSRLGFTRHAICAEQASYAFLAHQIFGASAGPLAAHEAAADLCGVCAHDSAEFITHRTRSKQASFSWKNRVMGMVIPIGPGHEGNPYFTVPITSGLVGTWELASRATGAPKVTAHEWTNTLGGFETTGSILLNGGLLKQTVRVTSLGEKTLIYQDCVTAESDVSVSQELGVPLGIENDEITGGRRMLYSQAGKTTFDWKQPQPAQPIPGVWANVDGRLGVVSAVGSGLCYKQGRAYDPHMAVCTDVLYGSFSSAPRRFKAGEQVARRVVLFFVECSPRETSRLAQAFHIEEGEDSRILHLKLPEGGQVDLPLL